MSRRDTMADRIANAPTWNVGDSVGYNDGGHYRVHATVIKTFRSGRVRIRFTKALWDGTPDEKAEMGTEPWRLVPMTPEEHETRFDGICDWPGCRQMALRFAEGSRYCGEHKEGK